MAERVTPPGERFPVRVSIPRLGITPASVTVTELTRLSNEWEALSENFTDDDAALVEAMRKFAHAAAMALPALRSEIERGERVEELAKVWEGLASIERRLAAQDLRRALGQQPKTRAALADEAPPERADG